MNANTASLLTESTDSPEPNVLIVDDNPTNLGVISNFLEERGFEVMTARTGEAGLEIAQEAQPDLILLDVMMPGIDGFETCRRLKEEPTTQDIPVIFMTALADPENKIRGFSVGGVDYVTKPLHQEEILARVTTHLTIQKQRAKLEEANVLLSKRALQLETSNQVGRQATAILDLDELLEAVVSLIQAQFGYYFVGIWLLDEEQEGIILQASSVCQDCQPLQPGYRIPLDASSSVILSVCQNKQPYHTNDVKNSYGRRALKGLPKTAAELVLPLSFGERKIGVLDIHSDRKAAFDKIEQTVLNTLADQIAIAIHNARLYSLEKKLNADKDRFFSVVAHDLRGPFNPLLGLAKLLSQRAEVAPRDEVEELASGIHRSAQNVFALLENLLEWSRLQRGRLEYEPDNLPLWQIVEKNFELLEENAANKNITLRHEVNPSVFVYADQNMLNTVVRNLLSNALKFTPQGGEVSISARPSLKNPELLEVAVADTGVGITPENQEKLFRLDVSHTSRGTAKETGSGLGLIICQEMVEYNKGRIWIESEPGVGTTVKFTVPLV